jgi:N-acylglucosamine 2-epimerase
MKNDLAYWSSFRTRCHDELMAAGGVLPFWMKYGYDRKNGGVYTCLDRDGTLMDPTKSVWFQGRFGYIAASVYAHVKKDRRFLEASLSCCRFLEAHCFDTDGRAFFEVTAEGVPLRKRRYVFSECFAAIAYAEYAHASGDAVWAEKALELFKRIRRFVAAGETFLPAKYTPAVCTRGHSLTMILVNVATVLRQISDDPVLDQQIDESIESLVTFFMHPEFKALLETVGPRGEFIDTINGREINPGHAIETSWFLMDVAAWRGDAELLKTALTILDWSWDWGWDGKRGGIISFRDCKGFPPQRYEQDMKFWWPQCEAIIATAMAYAATGEAKYRRRHKQVADWAWKHLKDPEYPEWFGYLHRDGTVAQPAKGNIFKGPFHIPRMLVKMQDVCRTIEARAAADEKRATAGARAATTTKG